MTGRLRFLSLVTPLLFLFHGNFADSSALSQQRTETPGRTGASQTGKAASFAPFEQWVIAARSGDKNALAKMYSSNPPAQAQIGNDVASDSAEEPEFWANLAREGLVKFNPKILAISHPNPESTELVLRIEASLRTPRAGNNSNAGENGVSGATKNIVASMSQVWMKEADGWHIAATRRGNFVANAPFTLPQPAKPDTQLYPPPGAAQKDIDAALASAAREHKRVLVVFGANWCYDCHVLNTTFLSREFAPLVNANYVVVHVNIGDEGKDNLDLGKRLGVGLDRGIPSLAVLDPDGKVVYAQKNGEFESARKISPADVRNFLERWKPSADHSPTSKSAG